MNVEETKRYFSSNDLGFTLYCLSLLRFSHYTLLKFPSFWVYFGGLFNLYFSTVIDCKYEWFPPRVRKKCGFRMNMFALEHKTTSKSQNTQSLYAMSYFIHFFLWLRISSECLSSSNLWPSLRCYRTKAKSTDFAAFLLRCWGCPDHPNHGNLRGPTLEDRPS